MNKNKIKVLSIIFVAFCAVFSTFFVPKYTASANASAEIVMDVHTKRVLYSSNADEKKFMASTTKILTAIIIIEKCNLDEVVTVPKQCVGIEGSSIYLVAGEQLTVRELLYGLMLRSGNDCAETLAVHCSKTKENFAKLMNETAKRLGANDSNFVTPHGLHDDNHYTTAYDLALISSYAIKNPEFKKIVSTKKITISNQTQNYKRLLINKNKMLSQLNGATGIKTGYTKKAGRCLVTSCMRNGYEVVCVVLNCPPMWERTKTLVGNCFETYSMVNLLSAKNVVGFIEDDKTNEKLALEIEQDVCVPLKNGELEKIKIEYVYPKKLSEINLNDKKAVGSIDIYIENNLIFSQEIFILD